LKEVYSIVIDATCEGGSGSITGGGCILKKNVEMRTRSKVEKAK
jgi:hypothetical protein